MSHWCIFVAPENTSQADTIIVGPFQTEARARKIMEAIERRYGVDGTQEVPVSCMVMEMFPQTEVTRMF